MDMDNIRAMFGELSARSRTGDNFSEIESFYAGQDPPAFGKGNRIAVCNLDKFHDWNGRQIAPLFMACPVGPLSNYRDTGASLGKLGFQIRRVMFGGFPCDQLPLVGAAEVFQDYFP